MILIGNKSDLSDRRQVKMDEAMHYAEMNRKFIYINNILEIAYIETSALNASNVEKAFKNLVTEIYKISKAHQ
jgi:Ras-related protein Rab-11A